MLILMLLQRCSTSVETDSHVWRQAGFFFFLLLGRVVWGVNITLYRFYKNTKVQFSHCGDRIYQAVKSESL